LVAIEQCPNTVRALLVEAAYIQVPDGELAVADRRPGGDLKRLISGTRRPLGDGGQLQFGQAGGQESELHRTTLLGLAGRRSVSIQRRGWAPDRETARLQDVTFVATHDGSDPIRGQTPVAGVSVGGSIRLNPVPPVEV
jgi:hypothetical protein